jgi:hypothetical protein
MAFHEKHERHENDGRLPIRAAVARDEKRNRGSRGSTRILRDGELPRDFEAGIAENAERWPAREISSTRKIRVNPRNRAERDRPPQVARRAGSAAPVNLRFFFLPSRGTSAPSLIPRQSRARPTVPDRRDCPKGWRRRQSNQRFSSLPSRRNRASHLIRVDPRDPRSFSSELRHKLHLSPSFPACHPRFHQRIP